MYQTIVVPLDGSQRAEAILPHVEELARHYEARLVFVRVVEPPPFLVTPGQPDMRLHEQQLNRRTEEAKEYLEKIQGEFRNKGFDTRTMLAHGAVVEAIINTAESQDADLIALASHGRSGLAQVFYGSVAAGVLNRADRPLLLIRAQELS